jgi:stage II sporulation protein D
MTPTFNPVTVFIHAQLKRGRKEFQKMVPKINTLVKKSIKSNLNKIILFYLLLSAMNIPDLCVASNLNLRQTQVAVRILSKYHPRSIWLTDFRSLKTIEIRCGKEGVETGGKRMKWVSSRALFSIEGENTDWAISGSNWKKRYTGDLEFKNVDGELLIVNRLPVEAYVPGVLAAEHADAPFEALKAQAVLARTLAYYKIEQWINTSEEIKPEWHLGDLTKDQAFQGAVKSERLKNAARETKNLVILYKKRPIFPFYHSSCGTTFFSPKELWNGPSLAYLRTSKNTQYRSLPSCQGKSHLHWRRSVDRQVIQDILNDRMNIVVLGDYPRRNGIKIELGPAHKPLHLERFRLIINRKLGWNTIKSNDYILTHEGSSIVFRGSGLGHNIGLCQCQAAILAGMGYEYTQIINTYYRRIKIAPHQVSRK